MSKLTDLIREKATTEYPFGGLVYRLKPCVGVDLLQRHRSLLVALLPPNPAEMMAQAAIDEASGDDKSELMRMQARESWERISNPENQAAAYEANKMALIAACVAIKEDGPESEWEAVRIVEDESERDHKSSPVRFHLSDLPPGAIERVGSIAREVSFGGEEARNRIAAFCEQHRANLSVREGG